MWIVLSETSNILRNFHTLKWGEDDHERNFKDRTVTQTWAHKVCAKSSRHKIFSPCENSQAQALQDTWTRRKEHIASNTSVTFTLRRPYGGRRTPKSSDSCGCRRTSAVAAGPPYGESLCFTGSRGGHRIIAQSYNLFHFYVRRRNLTRRRLHGRHTAAVQSPYGPLAYALIFVIKTTATVRHHLKGPRAAAVFLSP